MRRGGREDGASAVEFALVLPILVLLLFGIMQFGIILAANQGLEAAAREGGRLAAVGRDVTSTNVEEAVTGTAVPFVSSGAIDVQTPGRCTSAVDDGAEETIKIIASVAGSDYGVNLLGFIGLTNPGLTAEAVFRCEAPHRNY